MVRNSADALFDAALGNPIDSNFYAQFSIPMFNSFFRSRQEQFQAGVEYDNSLEAERETRLRVEETVRGALLELSNQWESLRIAERSLDIAQEALRLAREEYRIGTRSFEDLRATFDQEADTRRQVISARHAFVDALLNLQDAVGTAVRVPGASAVSGGR